MKDLHMGWFRIWIITSCCICLAGQSGACTNITSCENLLASQKSKLTKAMDTWIGQPVHGRFWLQKVEFENEEHTRYFYVTECPATAGPRNDNDRFYFGAVLQNSHVSLGIIRVRGETDLTFCSDVLTFGYYEDVPKETVHKLVQNLTSKMSGGHEALEEITDHLFVLKLKSVNDLKTAYHLLSTSQGIDFVDFHAERFKSPFLLYPAEPMPD